MKRRLVVSALLVSLTSATLLIQPASAAHGGQEVYALLKHNVLRSVLASDPDGADPADDVQITGLRSGEKLVGIDFRPRDGQLYGVGSKDSGAVLYRIDAETGVATVVAPLVTVANAPIVLVGEQFGVDFNPAADAMRIVSDTGQNLRAFPSATTPAGVARTTGQTIVDGNLNEAGGTGTGIVGAGYINNDNDPATGTTLYDIDAATDRLLIQNPPNSGTLVNVGSLQVPTRPVAGFDILTIPVNGVATNFAYIATTSETGKPLSSLRTIDLATGATATEWGTFGVQVLDIAVEVALP